MKRTILFLSSVFIYASLIYALPQEETIQVVAPITSQDPFTKVMLTDDYHAFEPYIDEQTMKIHYTKYYDSALHHLNKICQYYPQLKGVDITDLLTKSYDLPAPVSTSLKKVAGDVYNHTFFFESLSTQSTKEPLPNLKAAITKHFGSFEQFKDKYIEAASEQSMYGFVWLVINDTSELEIIYTKHFEAPNLKKVKPLIGIDTWIHAYYLTYDNEVSKYLDNIFNVLNWERAEKLYLEAIQ